MDEKINFILSEWDPIEVGYPMNKYEYTQYISLVKKSMIDKETLSSCLINIIKTLGLDYSQNDNTQARDIENITNKLLMIQ